MKRHQTGEVVTALAIVMVVMMVAMVAGVWQGRGHMGMGHGAAQAEKPAETAQPAKTEPSPPAPQASPEHQH